MLVHELVHLLNRRFLGPALPSWLDEGLAEELAMSRIAADGTLVPGSLGRFESGSRDRALLVGGGEIHLGALRAGMRRGDLPTLEELVGLDRTGFQAEDRFQIHYALSAFWVRYLLSGAAPAGADGFRSFLAAVAEGEPLDEELLLRSSGRRLARARERLPPLARRRRRRRVAAERSRASSGQAYGSRRGAG